MFSCQLCDRSYATQHSLTRHSHNHRKTSEHVCPSCKVVFYRKDLLARHSKMHDPAQGGNQGGRRLRCHTACNNCRDARIKCDSNQPCASCSSLARQCTYSMKSSRVSTNNRHQVRDGLETEPGSVEEEFTAPLPADCSYDFVESPPIVDNTDAGSTSMAPPNAMEGIDFGDLSPGQMTAWPWLHENLFLQQDYSTGWVGAFDLGFIDQNAVLPQDFTDTFMDLEQNFNAVTATESMHQLPQQDTFTGAHGKSQKPPPVNQWNIAKPPNGDKVTSYAPRSNGAVDAQQRENGVRVSHVQTSVIADLIAYAKQATSEPLSRGGHATYWQSMSMRVRAAFQLDFPHTVGGDANHCLAHLVQLYWDNFWSLWPLFPQHSFDSRQVSPVLYLVLGSIGAMYGGPRSSHYGVLMHEALRDYLCESLLGLEESDAGSLSLAQARLLTQVAALYFGQKRAFSYAQHLGSVLIAQTRRMDLYSTSRHQKATARIPSTGEDSSETSVWLARWLLSESRKRLAFGILRAEVYTSVLLNARPLLCSEEVGLELPCSNYLWQTKFASDAQFITAIRQDSVSNVYERLPFSDVVRIAMERNEPSPPLNISSLELLIFGLQEHVWRLCHDPDTFSRLIGSQTDSDVIYDGLDDSPKAYEREIAIYGSGTRGNRSLSINSSSYSLESHLTGRLRQMPSLRFDRKKTAWALWNWRQLLTASRGGELTRTDRTSLMSSLLLFHLSFLRIFAPIEKLHHISYRVSSDKGPESEMIHSAWAWSRTEQSKVAVQHACIIWNLLFQECDRPEGSRAWFNFMALLGLHHAAVVIWTYAGTHESGHDSPDLRFGNADNVQNKVPVVGQNSRELMTMFVRLYSHISPAWSVRSSFSAAAVRLANNEFPIQPD